MNEKPAELVPGTFWTVRVFKRRWFGLGKLAPVTFPGRLSGRKYENDPRVWFVAECSEPQANNLTKRLSSVRYQDLQGSALDLYLHRIGVGSKEGEIRADCTCGFYSFYRLEHAFELADEYGKAVTRKHVFAVVENKGRVFHHAGGIRSQQMRIAAIAPVSYVSLRRYIASTSPRHELSVLDRARCFVQLVILRWATRGRYPVFSTGREMLKVFPLSPPP